MCYNESLYYVISGLNIRKDLASTKSSDAGKILSCPYFESRKRYNFSLRKNPLHTRWR